MFTYNSSYLADMLIYTLPGYQISYIIRRLCTSALKNRYLDYDSLFNMFIKLGVTLGFYWYDVRTDFLFDFVCRILLTTHIHSTVPTLTDLQLLIRTTSDSNSKLLWLLYRNTISLIQCRLNL